MLLSKNQMYLFILSVLIALKFVFLPILEWQSSVTISSTVLNKQITKYQMISSNRELIFQNHVDVKRATDAIASVAERVEDLETFKLIRQQMIEKTLADFNISVEHFGWLPIILSRSDEFSMLAVDLRVSGRVLDFMQAMLVLEEKYPSLLVENSQLNIRQNSEHELGEFFGQQSFRFIIMGLPDA